MSGGTAAVILGAGFSSRMGWFKPLLPLGKCTVIERAIGCFLAAGVEDVLVVVGYRADEVVPVVTSLGIPAVANPRYEQGMLSSVLAGVSGLGPEVDSFFLLPGDMPLVRPETVRALMTAYRGGGFGVVYPVYRGERGHPPLISTRYKDEIFTGNYPGGLREFLSTHEDEALDLEVEDGGVVFDLDLAGDYQDSLLGLNSTCPGEAECYVLLRRSGTPRRTIEHSRIVSEVGRRLAAAVNRGGGELNLDLVAAAGLLHDIAKGQQDHPRAGAEIVTRLGYQEVARIVGNHQDIVVERDRPIDEGEIVYLSDKLVDGLRVIDMKERVIISIGKARGDRAVLELIEKRLDNAALIQERVEAITGAPVRNLLEGGL
ncbi:MAG: NTP transferase domain-containing protein [Firmicutes bacterium]|nr:NTP transferase domain-containing protein [Bacillota bacterium]